MRQEDHAKVSKSLAASYRLSHDLAAAAPKLLLASSYICMVGCGCLIAWCRSD